MVAAAKKPAGGAFGQWLNANRTSLAEKAKADGVSGAATGVAKTASTVWKLMSEADKAPWESKFKEALAAYNAYKNSDSYVKPEKKAKRGDGKKKKKDKNAPKKPAGGGYGVFFNEKREDFKQAAVAKSDVSFGGGAKLAGEAWKAMSEEQKKPYTDKYMAKQAEYAAAMAVYKEKKAAEAGKFAAKVKAGKLAAKVKAGKLAAKVKAEYAAAMAVYKAAAKTKAAKLAAKVKAEKLAEKAKAAKLAAKAKAMKVAGNAMKVAGKAMKVASKAKAAKLAAKAKAMKVAGNAMKVACKAMKVASKAKATKRKAGGAAKVVDGGGEGGESRIDTSATLTAP